LSPEDIRSELARRLKLRAGVDKLYTDLNVRYRQFLANPQHLTYVLDWLVGQSQPGHGARELVRSRGRLLEYCIERRLRLPEREKDFATSVLQAVGYSTSRS